MNWTLGGRLVRSLLQLSERWPCHIWLVGRMKFALLGANLGGSRYFSLSHSSFLSPCLEGGGGGPSMTEILLTGT